MKKLLKRKKKFRKLYPIRKCVCGSDFVPQSPNQIYHDPDCRYGNYYKRKEKIEMVCSRNGCDTKFSSSHHRKVYCSTNCRLIVGKQRYKEMRKAYDESRSV